MDFKIFYLISSFLLCTTFISVEAIKCFQCDSFDEGCSSLKETDVESAYFKDCGNEHASPFCRKTIQTILDTTKIVRITRSCGWITTHPNSTRCSNYDTQFKLDVTCQCFDDGCNSGISLSYKSFVLGVSVLVVIKNVFF